MFAIALVSMLIQSPPAQSAPDWIGARDAETVAAVLAYDQGLSLIVLCRDQRLETRIGGLPASAADIRQLQINIPGNDLRDSTWIVGADQTTALSTAPGNYARRLRAVERLIVRVPPEGDSRAVRYELPMPEAREPLDAVLTACNTPLERAEDADFEPEAPLISWEFHPIPSYPSDASSEAATVRLSCLVEPGGGLSGCRVLEESPRLQGFGRAALQVARRARVGRIDGQEITESRQITYTINFRNRP